MSGVNFSEIKMKIPTYPSGAQEQLPMFAENRVHQRTSGNPYPNKVVVEAQREVKIDEEYTVLKLENDFLEVAILPALGGKVWYALDKKNGYEFFYKNNVIKPALIGVLGNWTSGGMEFNWPFHHRASTFMPVDYAVERGDGEITVWLSEHNPVDRMRGAVGICLREGECRFETKVKLDNQTDVRRSFLWWENTAVPVNEQYEIFFPEDVKYVRFHYKRSVSTYPVANTTRFGSAFNGIYYSEDTDISKHKNTRHATSYFSADSKFDYFGGYDHGKKGGVVHIADHNISPGKKMFTWAYEQLSKTWEKALTDNDGAYAELMAGCYSDNQPDFSWIMPGESKVFSQIWYPIHDHGTPTFANEHLALYNGNKVVVQSVAPIKQATVEVTDAQGNQIIRKTLSLPCYEATEVYDSKLAAGETIKISVGEQTVAQYTFGLAYDESIPAPREEYPYFKSVKSAQQLYKLGLHVEQYRSPEYNAEDYYKEALRRDEYFTPALVALAEIEYKRMKWASALDYVNKAQSIACEYNTRLESGRLYYVKALILSAMHRDEEAYEYLYKAYFAADYKGAACLKLAFADIKKGEIKKARLHLEEALSVNSRAPLARAYYAYLSALEGNRAKALTMIEEECRIDPLNMFATAFKAVLTGDVKQFCEAFNTDISQDLMDVCERLYECGLTSEIVTLIKGASEAVRLSAMPLYLLDMVTGGAKEHTCEGIAFPSRRFEEDVLNSAVSRNESDFTARYLLGCFYYGSGNYEEGVRYFESAASLREDYRVLRCLAAAHYTHTGLKSKAKAYMKRAVALAPSKDKQMAFENAYFMAKTGYSAKEIEQAILASGAKRDDIMVELARAYNHQNLPDDALKTLLSREFVACEGGEHYIADQYMYAYYLKAKNAFQLGNYDDVIEFMEKARVIPESLGAGLWNNVRSVPYVYFEAMAYDKKGDKEKAKALLRGFMTYNFDYFTNMYLNTYRYYLAKAWAYLGDKAKADALIEEGIAHDLDAIKKEDAGYFSTTPLFISYIDAPKKQRKEYFAYRLYLYYSYLKEEEKAKKYADIMSKAGYETYITDFTE